MSLKAKIDQDIKQAMLAGDKTLVTTLRGLKSAILNIEVAEGLRDSGGVKLQTRGVGAHYSFASRLILFRIRFRMGSGVDCNSEPKSDRNLEKFSPKCRRVSHYFSRKMRNFTEAGIFLGTFSIIHEFSPAPPGTR